MAKKIWQNGRYITVEDDHEGSNSLDGNEQKDSFSLFPGGEKSRIERWGPPKVIGDLKKDLRTWGIGSIVLGVVSIILSRLLDPVWGIVLIVLGILNLLIRHRAMFIVNGLTLLAVGGLNIVSSFPVFSASGFTIGWFTLGIFQLGWGIQEIRKFNLYAPGRKI
jgi:hypothetical protein